MPARTVLIACLLAASALARPGASATAATFDNPKVGDAPCVNLNRFEVTRAGSEDAPRYRADAVLENACGRSVEVSFCLMYAEAVEGADRHCVEELLRPWAASTVVHEGAPVRITGPEYRWRYLPVE